MARTGCIVVPPGEEDSFPKAERKYQGSFSGIAATANRHIGRRQKERLKDKSYLQDVGGRWSGFDDSKRSNWQSAGGYGGLGGYRLFVQDTSYRKKNDMAGEATPSDHHQFKSLRLYADEVEDYQKLSIDSPDPPPGVSKDLFFGSGKIEFSVDARVLRTAGARDVSLGFTIVLYSSKEGQTTYEYLVDSIDGPDAPWQKVFLEKESEGYYWTRIAIYILLELLPAAEDGTIVKAWLDNFSFKIGGVEKIQNMRCKTTQDFDTAWDWENYKLESVYPTGEAL